jgi:hypothetical protein
MKKQEECDKNYSEMKPLDCHMKERRMAQDAKEQASQKKQ